MGSAYFQGLVLPAGSNRITFDLAKTEIAVSKDSSKYPLPVFTPAQDFEFTQVLLLRDPTPVMPSSGRTPPVAITAAARQAGYTEGAQKGFRRILAADNQMGRRGRVQVSLSGLSDLSDPSDSTMQLFGQGLHRAYSLFRGALDERHILHINPKQAVSV